MSDNNVETILELNEDIDNILYDLNNRNPVKLRNKTPLKLISNGIKDLPIYENPSHIRKNILTEEEARKIGIKVNKRDHFHGLGKEIYIQAINSLDDPRLIFKYKDRFKDYLVVTMIKDMNNNVIVVPIEVEAKTTVNNKRIHINRIKSVYGFENKDNIDLNKYIKFNLKTNKFEKIYKKVDQGTGFSTVARSTI